MYYFDNKHNLALDSNDMFDIYLMLRKISFLMLYFQMKIGKKAAIAAGLFYSLCGFLLNPEVLAKILHKEEYEMYLVRRIAGWISPLNHATYGMHDFGYDVLPSIWQSCCIFMLILFSLSALTFYTLKKYNFSSFTGEIL